MSDHDGESIKREVLRLKLDFVLDTDLDEAERMGRGLRSEIAQLDVEDVRPAPGRHVPEGAKGVAVDWTTVLVTFATTGGVVTSLVALVRDWLGRHYQAREIAITIDDDTIVLGKASDVERDKLINEWICKHSGT